MSRNFANATAFLILLMILSLFKTSEDPRQGVNIDVTIPNEAFKKSFVVNLSPGEKIHILGAEENLINRKERKLNQGLKATKKLKI